MENRGCGCFGFLILILAVYGGYQGYLRLSDSGGCDGWNEWAKTSEQRFNSALSRAEQLSPFRSTEDEVLEFADSLRDDAKDERASDPPEEGKELSNALASFYTSMAANFEAQALGENPPVSNSELQQQSDNITELMEQSNDECGS